MFFCEFGNEKWGISELLRSKQKAGFAKGFGGLPVQNNSAPAEKWI